MDGSRFDDMTRRLSGTASRRRAIGLLAGALGGALVVGDAAAGLGHRRGVCRPIGAGCTRGAQCCSEQCATSRALPRRHRNRCACPEGLASCGGACVDTQTDVANCGACGEVCGSSGEVCVSGVCESPFDCTTYTGTLLGENHTCYDRFVGQSIVLNQPCNMPNYQGLWGDSCTSDADCDSPTSPDVAVCVKAFVYCIDTGNCKGYTPQGTQEAGVCVYGNPGSICPPI